MNKPTKIKIALCVALWLSCIFDTFTFLKGGLFAFEGNPLYLFTKSIFILLLFKFAVNAGITYLLFNYEPKKSYKYAYLLVVILIYAFIGQSLGGYTNLDVATEYKQRLEHPKKYNQWNNHKQLQHLLI